jgi:hypothetical protein
MEKIFLPEQKITFKTIQFLYQPLSIYISTWAKNITFKIIQ